MTANPLLALEQKWRDEAPSRAEQLNGVTSTAAQVLHSCADELAAALSQAGVVETRCYVGDMKTSAGTDYYVCIERNGKRITPHKYTIRGRAEYDVAMWNNVLNDAPEPDILAYETAPPINPPEVDSRLIVPEGFVLVPREPTEAMLAAAAARIKEVTTTIEAGPAKGATLVREPHYNAYRAMLAAAPAAQGPASLQIPTRLDPHTADLVARFASALAEKLLAAQDKYGYSHGWINDDWMDECRAELVRHVAKGDPRDVAAYCAFLWHHDERTAAAPAVVVDEVREQFHMCRHPAWPDPLKLQAETLDEALREIAPNYRDGIMLLRTLTGGRVEYAGEQLRQMAAAALGQGVAK